MVANGGQAARDLEIYRRWMNGERQTDLAKAFGLTQQTVSTACSRVRATMPDTTREQLAAVIAERLELLYAKVSVILDSPATPVTVGVHGDILTDPDTGETVRDHSTRLRAAAELRADLAALSKLLGVDAPSRSEVSGTMRYEVVGLEPGALE